MKQFEYRNLMAEIVRHRLTQSEIAKDLGISKQALNNKILFQGFRTEEMFEIRNRYFPNLTIDYLFQPIKKEHPTTAIAGCKSTKGGSR